MTWIALKLKDNIPSEERVFNSALITSFEVKEYAEIKSYFINLGGDSLEVNEDIFNEIMGAVAQPVTYWGKNDWT